jgi:hypothetical protein
MKERQYDSCPAFPHVESYGDYQNVGMFEYGSEELYTFVQMHEKATGSRLSTDPHIAKLQEDYAKLAWKSLLYVARAMHEWPLGAVQRDGEWLHGWIDRPDEKKQIIERNNVLKKSMAIGINKINRLFGPDAPEPKEIGA